MKIGLVLIGWAAVIIMSIICLLGSGLVSIEIEKRDPDEDNEGKEDKN